MGSVISAAIADSPLTCRTSFARGYRTAAFVSSIILTEQRLTPGFERDSTPTRGFHPRRGTKPLGSIQRAA